MIIKYKFKILKQAEFCFLFHVGGYAMSSVPVAMKSAVAFSC